MRLKINGYGTICYITMQGLISWLAWLSLYTAQQLGVSGHRPGNDRPLRSLISVLSVMITAGAFDTLPSKPVVN